MKLKILCAFLFLVLFSGAATAEELVVLSLPAKGTYVLKVVIGADGVATVSILPITKVGTIPTPGPTPTPVTVPDGDFGLTKLAYDEAMKLTAEQKKFAAKLAENFVVEAAQIAAGARASIEESQNSLKDVNRETLGDNREVWLDWFVAWQVSTKKSDLTTLEDFAKAYNATAEGLKLVR